VSKATGRVITATAMDARPEFGGVDPLAPATLEQVRVRGGVVTLVAPAKSVLVVEMR
jgi:hypothetical protein